MGRDAVTQSTRLCFHCNDKFTIGHRCQRPQLLMIKGFDDARKVLYEEVIELQQQEDTNGGFFTNEPEPEITLHALTGWAAPRTMRMTAKMGPYEVAVLIDSGSTHNFISDQLASMLKLPMVTTEAFTVRVANGERLQCQGHYDKVLKELQGTKFYLTLFSLPLSGLDLVLGIQWLENRVCRLLGMGVQDIQEASLKEISKEFRRGHTVVTVCFQLESKPTSPNMTPKEMEPSLQTMLEEYKGVFKEPSSLPPPREVDHCIQLKEDTEAINVRPYKYAHFQKAEIKKQVHEMLQSGLIRPRTSPFSSLVPLVKKKDGNW